MIVPLSRGPHGWGGQGRPSDLCGPRRLSPDGNTPHLERRSGRAAGHEVAVLVLPLNYVPRALVNRETHGLFKLVADARTDRLLGAHVLAENAGDFIYAAVLALKFNLTASDLVGTFAPYLTMAEGLKLAARHVAGGVNVRHVGAQVLVDFDATLGIPHARLVEGCAFQIRRTPGGEHHHLRPEWPLSLWCGGGDGEVTSLALHPNDAAVGVHLHARGVTHVRQRL
ncbi:MAG: hypothetical protein HY332_19515 [Chloroflexi bacterium]|nr:hypothetical protein [Chloroflexota bacterium]